MPLTINPVLLDSLRKYSGNEELDNLGELMFKMYATNGFPPDMFLREVDRKLTLSLEHKVYIVSEYQTRMMRHKRLSGATQESTSATHMKEI